MAKQKQLTRNEKITARSFNSSPDSRKAGQSDEEHKEHGETLLPGLKHHKNTPIHYKNARHRVMLIFV